MSDDHQPGVLSDFQRATARHAFQRLYLDSDSSRRFLVADETGLGKTHVAEEVIARTVEHLQSVDEVDRIDIICVCSNADIAAQYIRKLNITNSGGRSIATRLSLLITLPDVLQPAPGHKGKPTTFVAFTPATSFQFGSQMGTATERAVLYLLLREHLGLHSPERDSRPVHLPGSRRQQAPIPRVVRRTPPSESLRDRHPTSVHQGV